jgi:hypothetical protein
MSKSASEWAFTKIEKYGPREKGDLNKRVYNRAGLVKLALASLLLCLPLTAVLAIGLVGTLPLLRGLDNFTLAVLLYGGGAVVAVLAYTTSGRLLFRPPDLLNSFRRVTFSQGWKLGGMLGVLVGIAAVLTRKSFGYDRNPPIDFSLFACGVVLCGQLAGVLLVWSSDKSIHKSVETWIDRFADRQ